MSIAIEERRQDFESTLKLCAQQASESAVGFVVIDPQHKRYKDVLPTTWTDLESRHYLVRILNNRVFGITGQGWLIGTHLLGEKENPEFQKKLGSVFAYLKNEVAGRQGEGFVGFANLCSATGLCSGLVHFIIESNLIEIWHNRYGARWHSKDQLILVPANFGLSKL